MQAGRPRVFRQFLTLEEEDGSLGSGRGSAGADRRSESVYLLKVEVTA